MVNFSSLPQILDFIDHNYDHQEHLNFKENEKWKSFSTKEFTKNIRSLALALNSLNVQKNSGFAIIAKPTPIWTQIDLAIISSGAISVPIFPDISRENLLFETQNADIKFVFCDCKDNLKTIQDSGAKFDKIIIYGFEAKDENIISFDDLLKIGQEIYDKNPDKFADLIKDLKENDLATIIYTSGSTGIPKGVEITHKNLISQIIATPKCFPLSSKDDVALSFLPLAHVFERMIVYFYLSQGIKIYFADDVKNVGNLLKEVNPTLITVVPRLLEKVFAKMQSAVLEASFVKKNIGKLAFHFAPKFAEDNSKNSFLYKVLNNLVYKKLRAAFGNKINMVVCGGAPLSLELEKFFLGIGINLCVGYGLTESSPVISANYKNNRKIGTIGKAFPDILVKVEADKELLAKGDNIMKGYHKNPQLTSETITSEGWLRTGDLASIDEDGYIKIIGRKKEMFKTATGKYVSPVPIEQKIMASLPILAAACIIADNRKFVSILLFPDFELLLQHKKKFGFENVNDEDFLRSNFMTRRIEAIIQRVNTNLNDWEKIQKFYIHNKPISIESGELTPSMKLKRGVVEEKLEKIIDKFYE